jgi:hypothetical protein|tara:strand:+ start:213 stop:464 length:252 start_codon:yes stop_codon:yes gene_type:complete
MVTKKELEGQVEHAEYEINHIRKQQGKQPIKLGVGNAYGRTYIYRDQLFKDNLFSGTKKECEIFIKGFYYQRVLQNRNYGVDL